MSFEIQKKGNPSRLKCSFSLLDAGVYNGEDTVAIEFGRNHPEPVPDQFPLQDIKGIRFFKETIDGEFLWWITPDVFLHEYWTNGLKAEVEGDYREFTKFKVHYIGESTDQEIWKRLTGHEKLQDVLSIENAFHADSISAHEVTLLLFQVSDANTINILHSSNIRNVKAVVSQSLPSKETITLDVEKALIKLLKPNKRYNKIQYKSYPKSKNGLYNDKYDRVSYKISDNISLQYTNVEIVGDTAPLKSTSIVVEDNKTLRLE